MFEQFLDKNGLIDKKKALNGLPFIFKSILEPGIEYVNKLDYDNNKVPDVVQFMPAIINLVHIGMAVAPYVNLGKFKAWFVNHDFITDQEAVNEQLDKATAVVVSAAEKLGTK